MRANSEVQTWRAERCWVGRTIATNAELYKSYCAWCSVRGREPVTRLKFLADLRKLGHFTVEGSPGRRVGLALLPDVELVAAEAVLRSAGVLKLPSICRGDGDGDGGRAWQRSLSTGLSEVEVNQQNERSYWRWRMKSGWCSRCPWPAHTIGPDGGWWHAFCWTERDRPVPNESYERWLLQRAWEDGRMCCAECAGLVRRRLERRVRPPVGEGSGGQGVPITKNTVLYCGGCGDKSTSGLFEEGSQNPNCPWEGVWQLQNPRVRSR